MQAEASSYLQGKVRVPGDKSCSHRAVILAAMAPGESLIRGVADGDDVRRTAVAVRALGARVERLPDGSWSVRGGPWRSPAAPIDCGNSGSTARLLMGAVAGRPVTARFTGDESLLRRPMDRVAEPLRTMGARIEGGPTLPLTVRGSDALGGISFVNRHASAQVKSAVLLAGLGARGAVEVIEPLPSRDHTERMLGLFGVAVADGRLPERRRLKGAMIEIAGDPSSAAFPLVAALLAPGSCVAVENVLVNPLRVGLFDTLLKMGAQLEITNRRTWSGEPVADVTARSSGLRAVTVPARRAPAMIDEYPILAVAAAFAQGETILHGLGELRHKESDRLARIERGLAACGVAARVEGDTLRIRGGAVEGGAQVATGGDHRIAMSFLVLGLASRRPVRVDRPEMIASSFPEFAGLMRSIGAPIGPLR